jgi:uncharacterized protein (DUF362 family)
VVSRIIGVGAAGIAEAAASAGGAKPGGRGVVVIARDPNIWDGGKLNRDKVQGIVFKAVRELSGASDDTSAWKSFFKEDDHVSIKMNCIGGKSMSTTPVVTEAIISGALLAGVPPRKIAAWDRTQWEVAKAGYKYGRDKRGVLFTATDEEEIGYDGELSTWGEAGSLVSRIASEFSTAMVNAPILKDHDTTGISCSLKNWYGAINNPNKLHENACDPYIADLNMLPVFRDKMRLIVCDGTTGQYNGGPAHKPKYTWRYSGVIAGTDPVAVDTVAYHVIDEKRKAEGLPTLKDAGRPPKYLKTAGDEKHKLGENRYEKIRIIEV